MTMKTKVVGVDIRPTETTVAVVDVRGTIHIQEKFPTTDYPNVNAFVEALSERILTLAQASGGYETVRSVGISAPSANFLTGCIENAGNMLWKGVIPLAAMVRDSLGLAVAVGNDAHVTAMGEYVYGAAHGMENFIVVSLGHGGVGSCIFSNGRPLLGTGGYAGEIGHYCVKDGGRTCTCGRQGCLEEYASERGVIQTARELLEESDVPSMMRDLDTLTPQTIGECCRQGDGLAQEVWRRTGYVLGMALANYSSMLDPEAIILTGELVTFHEWLMEPLRQSFEELVFHNIRSKVKIVPSLLDNSERDVLGASALAWKVKEYSLFK